MPYYVVGNGYICGPLAWNISCISFAKAEWKRLAVHNADGYRPRDLRSLGL